MKEKLKSLTAIFYTPILIYFVFYVAISLVAIASATPVARVQYPLGNFVMRQMIFFAIGIVAVLVVLFFELKRLRFIRWGLYFICLILLALVYFVGERYPCIGTQDMLVPCLNGATRWINIPIPGLQFQLQPSEFMRIALILVLADIMQVHNEKFGLDTRTFKSDFWLITKSILVLIVPIYLIYDQPDTGITILILVTTAFMLITAGIKWTYILAAGGIAAAVTVTFLNLVINNPHFLLDNGIIVDHQYVRFVGWFDPFSRISHEGRHLALGLIAMASGGLFGNGFASGAHFFPEAHTDYIFAVIGMDFGMIGSSIVILLNLLFSFTILKTAVLNREHYNNHVCVGIFASLMAQQFWNIGMIVGLLPISGVTLPFISHGGSSVLASMIMLGIILTSHVEGLTIKRSNTVFREDILYLNEKLL